PKVQEGDSFRCAFTAAGGWGTYAQSADGGALQAELAVKWGSVTLKTLSLA
nr:hypothetical protein [Desulfuromonadales bacterium]